MPLNPSTPDRSRRNHRMSTWGSPLERKETLRSVLSRAKNLQDTLSMAELEEVIAAADDINLDNTIEDKATCQDEFVMDSQVMTTSSRILGAACASLNKEISSYNEHFFVDSLLSYVRSLPDSMNEEIDWTMLDDEVQKMFKRTPPYSTLLGCLDPLKKKVAVKRQVGKRDALAPMKKPEAIVTVSSEDRSVEESVRKIKKLITERCRAIGGPIDFYCLVLHPRMFGRTVENMLHVAFLVRDGLMGMSVSDEGNLLIEPTSKGMRNGARGKPNVQHVLALNVDQWRTLVDIKEITEPMIDF